LAPGLIGVGDPCSKDTDRDVDSFGYSLESTGSCSPGGVAFQASLHINLSNPHTMSDINMLPDEVVNVQKLVGFFSHEMKVSHVGNWVNCLSANCAKISDKIH
jgi:hypothetical protein